MTTPFFSVIVPTKNRPEFLIRALSSIKKQTFSNYEVIVIDDASSCSYRRVVEKFSGLITFIKNEYSLGAAGARNIGIRRAKGTWISFLDDDDEFHSEFLETAFYKLIHAEQKVGYLWTSVKKQFYDPSGFATEEKLIYYNSWYPDSPVSAKSLSIGCGYGLIIKRTCFDEIGLFNESFKVGEDTDLILRLIIYGFKPLICAEIGVTIHEHQLEKLTGQDKQRQFHTYDILLDKYLSFIKTDQYLFVSFVGGIVKSYISFSELHKARATLKLFSFQKTNWFIFKHYLHLRYMLFMVKTKQLLKGL